MIHTILLWTVIESVVMLHLNVTLDMYYLDQIQLPAKQMEHGVQVPYAQNLLVIFMLSQLQNITLFDSLHTFILVHLHATFHSLLYT